MHTINLTQRELEELTYCLDGILIGFEGEPEDNDLDNNTAYQTIKSIYTKLLGKQLGVFRP